MEFLRRRRRLFLGVAAGAAGAAAAFYWWTANHHTKLQQQRSVEMELSAILRGAALHHGAGSGTGAGSGDEAVDGNGDPDGDDCGSPDLDDSLDSHFNYIQKVSAPQELSNLLPRIQATLFKLTDVTLVKQLYQQQQQQQQQQQEGHSVGGSGNAVQAQLRLLARLCFGRTVAAAFLLPLMDLSVRTKLNIIGRHLFLQEKFSKLRQPSAPSARMRLPPRLTAAAVETFLACEHLAERGCSWLVEQAMSAVDRVLEGTPLDTHVTPEQLVEMVQAMATSLGQGVTAAAATSATGCAWVDTVVGPTSAPAVGADATATSGSAEAYRRALANAAMVEELESELRRVLCNYRFGEALHAAVSQCLSTCAVHIHATFISQAAAAVNSAHQQQQHQQPQGAPAAEPAPAGDSARSASDAPSTDGPAPSSQTDPNPHQPQDREQGQDHEQEQEENRQEQAHVISPFSTASRGCASPSPTTRGSGSPPGPGCEDPDKVKDASAAAAAAGTEPSASPRLPAVASPRRSGGSGSSGGGAQSMSRAASLAAAAVAAMQPRPLARCLKAVQGACDPLFVDAREVSARIACLPPVMSLCAVAFAAPLEL